VTGKQLGKIQSVSFGHGGYHDAMIGISFTLSGEGWGVGDFWGAWSIKRSEEDRIRGLGEMVMRVNDLLQQAKVSTVDRLKGIPVEVSFEGNLLKSWRVLTEVL
jgi:hypothetical protein